MSIRIGTYDFFAHLVGGGFFLASILYLLQRIIPLPISVTSLSTVELLGLGAVAYVLGHVAHRLSSMLWYRFFAPKDLYQRTIQKLSQDIPSVKFNFEDTDWYTLVAYIKKHSADMAQDVEHFHAVSIMLRSTSFSLLLFGLVFGVEFFTNNYSYSQLILCVISLFLSVILVRISVTYNVYFYRSIHQSVIALVIKPEELPIQPYAKADIQKSAKPK